MRGKARGTIALLVIVLVIVMGGLYYVYKQNQSNNLSYQMGSIGNNGSSNAPFIQNISTCQGQQLLTANLTDLRNIDYIIPLGNISPGAHTTPSDHIYFTMKQDGNSHPLQANVYSPGDIHIFEIDSQHLTEGGFTQDDFSIYFTPCRGVTFFLYHVLSLSPRLTSVIQNTKPQQCADIVIGTTGYGKSCHYSLDYHIQAKELLGSVGGALARGSAFDFGSFDTRTRPLNYVNPQRPLNGSSDQWLHITCPLDYFSPDIKTAMYSFLGNKTRRTIEPRCGTVMQDSKGTAQGNWFTYPVGQILHGQGGEEKQLALIHNNIDPTVGEISVGGTIVMSGGLLFTPTHSGTINREFGEVKSDNSIYCYQFNISLPGLARMPMGSLINGKILIQLLDANTLRVEHQSGSCLGNENFNTPTTYVR